MGIVVILQHPRDRAGRDQPALKVSIREFRTDRVDGQRPTPGIDGKV